MKNGSGNTVAHEDRDTLIAKGLEVALYGDTSSDQDKAVFFSGADEKRQAADFCRKNPGYKHVCMTEALHQFDDLKLFGRGSPLTIKEIYDLGDIISERFAQEASGNVTIFIGPKCKPHGTFMRVELPAIMSNEAVLTINGNPKQNYNYLLNPNINRPNRQIASELKIA